MGGMVTPQPFVLTSKSRQSGDRALCEYLLSRIGSVHFHQRLGIEAEKEHQVFGQGRTFFHIENWALAGVLIKAGLKASWLWRRGQRNARRIVVRHNTFTLPNLPRRFDGYTLLHISDSHLDMAMDMPHALIEAVQQVDYDCCVWTGDFRARTCGDWNQALAGLEKVRPHLKEDVYAVLGNHDSLRMVPAIEALQVRVLLNEQVALRRGEGDPIYLAGIDDPHYYRTDNFDRATAGIPPGAVSLLLAHSPEVYRHAAFANFDVMLCGHTHGGQICLPGGRPLIINADCPRTLGRGGWQFKQLQGYTSVGSGACVVDVRFNCPPEITVHHLRRGDAGENNDP